MISYALYVLAEGLTTGPFVKYSVRMNRGGIEKKRPPYGGPNKQYVKRKLFKKRIFLLPWKKALRWLSG
jgi:hypothetical protein